MNGNLFECGVRSPDDCEQAHGKRCYCDLPIGHDGHHHCMCGKSGFIPDPPTGPEVAGFTEFEKSREGFIEWCLTDWGKAGIRWMARAALRKYKAGDDRISVNKLSEDLRDTERIKHPNDYRPWFADLMVYLLPQLLDLIQRKSRKKCTTLTAEELKLIGDGL